AVSVQCTPGVLHPHHYRASARNAPAPLPTSTPTAPATVNASKGKRASYVDQWKRSHKIRRYGAKCQALSESSARATTASPASDIRPAEAREGVRREAAAQVPPPGRGEACRVEGEEGQQRRVRGAGHRDRGAEGARDEEPAQRADRRTEPD